MVKRMIIMLVLAGLVLGGIFGFEAFKAHMVAQYLAHMSVPAQTVSSLHAEETTWQPQLHASATLHAVRGADLAFDASGIVEDIYFDPGEQVARGALLMTLRAEDDIAKLHSLEATAQLAKITYDRDQKMLQAQAISQAQLDAAKATYESATAQVAQQQVLVDKKSLRAPFTGHVGIRQLDIGQYVSAGTTAVTLQSLDPIFADFYLPQQNVTNLHIGQQVTLTSDGVPGQTFTGRIAGVNPKIDVNSRNVLVRAALDNPKNQLLPGMYANVTINYGTAQKLVTLPQTAITYNPYGDTVYLVAKGAKGDDGKEKLTAQQSFVTVGETRGDQVAILKGVKAGDEVVTTGQQKLHNGAPIIINNQLPPTNDPDPHPTDGEN